MLRAAERGGKGAAGARFAEDFDHAERPAKVSSRRALVLFPGREEGVPSRAQVLPEDAAPGRRPRFRPVAPETFERRRIRGGPEAGAVRRVGVS